MLRFRAPAALLLLVLSGCADMGPVRPQATLTPAAQLATGAAIAAAPPAAWPEETWWQALGDPQLDRLVAAAIENNPSLKGAQARVRQAEALAGAAEAATGPRVDASAAINRERYSAHGTTPPPLAGNWAWRNTASVTASYDLDLWGRNRDLLAAALGEAQMAAAEAQLARLSLETAVVRAYVQLWLAHAQHDAIADSLAQRQRILDIVRRRHAAGLATEADVAAIETTLPAGRREQEQVNESQVLLRHQLAALIGQGPGDGDAIVRPALALPAGYGLPANLPAELVARRPDLVAQRWRVEAAGKGIAAARADFYPNLNLVAYAGLQSLGFAKFLDAGSQTRGVAPALSLPIFDGGRLRSQLGSRSAQYDMAVEQYNATLVQALSEVANAVARMQSERAQQKLAESAMGTARKSQDLAERAYKAGMNDALAMLNARLVLLSEQQQLLQVQSRCMDTYASLMAALGGGIKLDFP